MKNIRTHVSISIILNTYLFYFQQLLVGCFNFEPVSLVAIPAGVTNSAVETKICALQQESKSISQL